MPNATCKMFKDPRWTQYLLIITRHFTCTTAVAYDAIDDRPLTSVLLHTRTVYPVEATEKIYFNVDWLKLLKI